MSPIRTPPRPDVLCLASWNADLICRVDQPLQRGETVVARSFQVGPGGKGSNAAMAAARQGARVALLARVGDDDFGHMALALWQQEGLDTSQVEVVAGERSGVAQILVFDDGDNSIAVFPGTNAGLQPRHVDRCADLLQHCRVVLASNEVPAACTLSLLTQARRAGKLTVLNPAPALAMDDGLLALVDVLTPNAGELRSLAGLPEDAPLEAAAQRLLTRGVGAVVVTLGGHGCALFTAALRDAARWPGHAVPVVDTIGAGDCFTGALAAALARGRDLPAAVTLANAAAALSVQGAGAWGAVPSLREVEDWLGGRQAGAERA